MNTKPNSRRTHWLVLLSTAVMLAACASPGPSERRAARLAQFEAAAAAPVESFHFWAPLYKWEALGETTVAVWTRAQEVYLIRVQRPCTELEWTSAIGLTSTMNRVATRFDSVVAGDQRCRITEIRPVDAEAVRQRPAT